MVCKVAYNDRRTRSGFARISWDQQGVGWACTDPELFEAVVADLAQMDPGCEVDKFVPERTFVGPYECRVCMPINRDKRGRPKWDYSHREVAWWIMKQLCEQGWEPFDASGVCVYRPHCDFGNLIKDDGDFYLRLVARAD